MKQEKWNEAISCYNRAIDLVKDDAIYYANRGLCYLKKDRLVNEIFFLKNTKHMLGNLRTVVASRDTQYQFLILFFFFLLASTKQNLTAQKPCASTQPMLKHYNAGLLLGRDLGHSGLPPMISMKYSS